MMNLFVLKERLKSLYQKYEIYVKPLVKFIIAMVVFMMINKTLGYDVRFTKLSVVLILSLISAFTPAAILVLLGAVLVIGHVYFVSKVLSIIAILLFFILYFLFLRFTPKLGFVVIAVPILFLLKIPYVIPILLGMIYTPIAIVPTSCGVIIYFFIMLLKDAVVTSANTGVEDTLQLYTYIVNTFMDNKQMLLVIIVFALVIISTYLVRKLKIDHVFDIAIITGATVNILGFLIGDLTLEISEQIFSMILGTIVSAFIVYIIQFFRLTLDYTAVEYVQFEDDDYYYYVKAVPKINVTTPQMNVKKINTRTVSGNTTDLKGAVMKHYDKQEVDEDFLFEDNEE